METILTLCPTCGRYKIATATLAQPLKLAQAKRHAALPKTLSIPLALWATVNHSLLFILLSTSIICSCPPT